MKDAVRIDGKVLPVASIHGRIIISSDGITTQACEGRQPSLLGTIKRSPYFSKGLPVFQSFWPSFLPFRFAYTFLSSPHTLLPLLAIISCAWSITSLDWPSRASSGGRGLPSFLYFQRITDRVIPRSARSKARLISLLLSSAIVFTHSQQAFPAKDPLLFFLHKNLFSAIYNRLYYSRLCSRGSFLTFAIKYSSFARKLQGIASQGNSGTW